MYINFKSFVSSELTPLDLTLLLAVKQKETTYQGPHLPELMALADRGFVEQQKNEGFKLTDKGNSTLEAIRTPHVTQEMNDTFDLAVIQYNSIGKDIGKREDAKSRLFWFMATTGFSLITITSAIKSYLDNCSDPKYIMALDNLIWKQPNVYAAAYNLKDSKLFDLICDNPSFRINTEIFYKSVQNVELRYLFELASVGKVPSKATPECYITMSKKSDEERFKAIKGVLAKKIRK